ncbi:hypothetical protein [Microcoleus sp. B3-D7]|uniref:hypothetical protein n=1 Tax=Microcoleus sp. B3-D7 TaxID=2818659 RepID=UPI002FD6A3E4
MTIWVHKIPQKPIVTVEGAESGLDGYLARLGQDCGWSFSIAERMHPNSKNG